MRSTLRSLALGLLGCLGSSLQAQGTETTTARPPGTALTLRTVASFPLRDARTDSTTDLPRVSLATFDRWGRVYAHDPTTNQVRQYSANGVLLRAFGKGGFDSPDYRFVVGLAIAFDSTVVVRDMADGTVTFFGSDGFRASAFRDPRATFGLLNDFTADSEGRTQYLVPMLDSAGGSPDVNTPVLIRRTANGGIADSLVLPTHVTTSPGRGSYAMTADGGHNGFQPVSHHAVLRGGGYVFGTGDRYRVQVRRIDGTSLDISRERRPVRLHEAERAEWTARAVAAARVGDSPQVTPEFKPFFRDLLADANDRIWVSLYAEASVDPSAPPQPRSPPTRPLITFHQSARFDVFDRAGRFLGEIALPPRSRLLYARDARVLVATRLASGEERLQILTVIEWES